jgi:hypothetical protein
MPTILNIIPFISGDCSVIESNNNNRKHYDNDYQYHEEDVKRIQDIFPAKVVTSA